LRIYNRFAYRKAISYNCTSSHAIREEKVAASNLVSLIKSGKNQDKEEVEIMAEEGLKKNGYCTRIICVCIAYFVIQLLLVSVLLTE
jgi:hypothetical protein